MKKLNLKDAIWGDFIPLENGSALLASAHESQHAGKQNKRPIRR
ncbi:MAG: hypothetical protein QXK89_08345 [Candidatus Bathyarchaeia archaeon]